jgi:hypothetical protein
MTYLDDESTICQLKFEFQSNYYNAWPKLEISVNSEILWSDFIVGNQTVTVDFEKKPTNILKIEYLNKRNGPGVYDTQVDQDGNILQDQYCILKNIYVDQAKFSFLINELVYHQLSGDVLSKINGWMPQRGYYLIEFPYDVYKWIIDLRNKTKMKHRKQSSLSYFTDYLGDNTNTEADEIIARIEKTVAQLP